MCSCSHRKVSESDGIRSDSPDKLSEQVSRVVGSTFKPGGTRGQFETIQLQVSITFTLWNRHQRQI